MSTPVMYPCGPCMTPHEATATVADGDHQPDRCSCQRKGDDGLWRFCHNRKVVVHIGKAHLCRQCAKDNGVPTGVAARLYNQMFASQTGLAITQEED